MGAIRGVLTDFLFANEGPRIPFSEAQAARTRDALVRRTGIVERRMFGGICSLLRGNILVGVRKDSLIARLGEEEAAKALKKSYVTQMGAPRRTGEGVGHRRPKRYRHRSSACGLDR
jgi:hypothetical protein